MEIPSYGRELLSKGSLTYKRNSKKYQCLLRPNFLMEWPSQSSVFDNELSEECIRMASSDKSNYESPLHFAWKNICFLNDVDNELDLLEIIDSSKYEQVNHEQALSEISKKSNRWLKNFSCLLPKKARVFSIWDEGLDLCFVFETDCEYVYWDWMSTA